MNNRRVRRDPFDQTLRPVNGRAGGRSRAGRWSCLPGLIVAIMLAGLIAPQAAAQGDGDPPPDQECPEGLVYEPVGDICVLPENLPAPEEEPPVEEAPVEEAPVEEAPVDEAPVDEAPVDEGEPPAEDEPDDAPAIAGDPTATIKNLTLLTFACPVNWNPATRDIEASREMCTEPIVPNMTYTVLLEGQELIAASLGVDVDLAATLGPTGTPLAPGMYTIRENLQEGLEDPFAFCAIYAADGTSRLTVQETVRGGELDILLAAGEEVNCEWYSVATVPEVTGDPNALPIGGLTLDGFYCPYGVDDYMGEALLITICTEGGLNGFEFTAALNGAVASTQSGPASGSTVDFQSGLDSRLLSGVWTLGVTPAAGYDESYIACTISDEAGAVRAVPGVPIFALALELGPGERGHCNLFNVEAEPRPGLSLGIQLLLHTCPEDFDSAVMGLDACTEPLPGQVGFDLIRGGRVIETATAPQEAAELRFTGNIESGEWTIRPNLPAGWLDPYVTCDAVDSEGIVHDGIRYLTPAADGGPGVTATFGPNHLLKCDVWFYAGDVRDSVVVASHRCPDDVDPANPASGDREVLCRLTQFYAIEYTIDGAAPVKAETGRNGLKAFPAQPGQWRIAVEPNEGHVVRLVSCNHTIAALGQVQTIEPTINADARPITFDLVEGDALRCDFFMGLGAASAEAPAPPLVEEPEAETTAPEAEAETTGGTTNAPDVVPETGALGAGAPAGEPETGGGQTVQVIDTAAQDDAANDPATEGTASLAIQHWDCPAVIAPETTADSLIEPCVASLQPSAWQLNGTPLDALDGYAVWEALPLELAVVSNAAASGQEDAASAVYCSLSLTNVDEPLIGVEAAVRGGTIELVFDQPSVVYCNWFLGP